MDRSALIEALRKYDAPLRQNGATGLYIFGSRARGTHRPDSDLDLFIDYDPDVRVPKLLRLIRLEREISADLGIPVTITTRYALHPLADRARRHQGALMTKDPTKDPTVAIRDCLAMGRYQGHRQPHSAWVLPSR